MPTSAARPSVDGDNPVDRAPFGPPPATPANMTLLRCSLCAEHTGEEVETILGIFEAAGKAVGIV